MNLTKPGGNSEGIIGQYIRANHSKRSDLDSDIM
jgi:hypothetical protein